MTTDTYDPIDVIEAFVDAEPVAPQSLSRALADETARDHLIDLLVLRGLVAGRTDSPISVAAPSSPPSRSSLRLWLIAASLVATSLLGGFLLGRQLERASTTTAAANQVTHDTPVIAPQPKHVIRLERGVDWTESAGGH